MPDTPVNYAYWDNPSLIDGFNAKSVRSFFASETHFLDAIDVPSLDGVLDVGCSCGRFVELLQSRGYRSHYTGVDVSASSIEVCRHNYPQLDFISGNYFGFSATRPYDLINATGVVQHEPHYKDLIAKMVRDSTRYVLFDVKLCDVPEPVVDIDRVYCELETSRIHMICFSLSHLMDFVMQLPGCGSVSLLGYPTRPNSATHGPSEIIDHWVSCGVFIDKSKPRGLSDIQCPPMVGTFERSRFS